MEAKAALFSYWWVFLLLLGLLILGSGNIRDSTDECHGNVVTRVKEREGEGSLAVEGISLNNKKDQYPSFHVPPPHQRIRYIGRWQKCSIKTPVLSPDT